jgi:hypothetical protein
MRIEAKPLSELDLFWFQLLIHGSALVQIQKTFDQAIDDPDGISYEYQPAYDNDAAQSGPEQTKPEGAHLPAKMTFQPGITHIVQLDVIDDDGNDGANANEKRQSIETIINCGQRFKRLRLLVLRHHFIHRITPVWVSKKNHRRIDSNPSRPQKLKATLAWARTIGLAR